MVETTRELYAIDIPESGLTYIGVAPAIGLNYERPKLSGLIIFKTELIVQRVRGEGSYEKIARGIWEDGKKARSPKESSLEVKSKIIHPLGEVAI